MLRRGFWYFVLALIVTTAPIVLISFLAARPAAVGTSLAAVEQQVTLAPLSQIAELLGLLQLGAVIAVAQQVHRRAALNVVAAYGQALRRFPALLVTVIVVFLAFSVGLVLFVVPGLFMLVRLSLAPYIVVAEGQGPFQALGKSYRMVRGFFWRVVGIFLVTWLLVLVVAALVQAPFGAGLTTLLGAGGLQAFALSAHSAIGATVGAVASVLVGALPTVTMFVLYTDLRVRKEGLDLAAEPQAV